MKIDINQIGKVIAKNIPHLLTGVGILWFGISATAAFDAGLKAKEIVQQSEDAKSVVKSMMVEVLPAVGAFAVGTSCVIMSDVASTRIIKSTEAAYKRLSANFGEYRAAVIGALGAEADKLACKVSTDCNSPTADEPDIPEGYFHFYDSFSRNDFIAKMEDVVAAEYYINRCLSENGFASINEFYDYLELPHIDRGNDLGWDIGELSDYSGVCWIDFENVEHTEEDGTKWYSIHYAYDPTIDGIIDWDAIRSEYHLRGVELFEAKAGDAK